LVALSSEPIPVFDTLPTLMTHEIKETLLTKEQVRQRLNLNSLRGVDRLLKAHRIPVIDLGHKTKGFYWPDIEEALPKAIERSRESAGMAPSESIDA
jgi:hypothetical protein